MIDPSPLFLMSTMALQVSQGSGTSLHRHIAAQVVIALEGKLSVKHCEKEPFIQCDAVLIPPNVAHQIAGPGPRSLMIWLDPATHAARAIRDRSASTVIPLFHQQTKCCLQALGHKELELKSCSDAAQLIGTVMPCLLPERGAVKPLDERIAAVLAEIPNLPVHQPYPLAPLARKVNLSEERLRHLFRQELGVPLQQYWVSARLITAIRRMGRSTSLTEVAQDAGFSDLSHFSRAFRAAFGMPPSLAYKDSRSIQAVTSEH